MTLQLGSLTAAGLTKWLVILADCRDSHVYCTFLLACDDFWFSRSCYPGRCVKSYSIISQECRRLSTKKDV